MEIDYADKISRPLASSSLRSIRSNKKLFKNSKIYDDDLRTLTDDLFDVLGFGRVKGKNGVPDIELPLYDNETTEEINVDDYTVEALKWNALLME